MYYFDLDAYKNYAHSKSIQIDTNKDGRIIEKFASKNMVKRCANAISKNKKDSIINPVLWLALKVRG